MSGTFPFTNCILNNESSLFKVKFTTTKLIVNLWMKDNREKCVIFPKLLIHHKETKNLSQSYGFLYLSLLIMVTNSLIGLELKMTRWRWAALHSCAWQSQLILNMEQYLRLMINVDNDYFQLSTHFSELHESRKS